MAAAEPVVTELTIDARGAERGQEQYARAMARAQAAQERMIATNTRLYQSQSQHERITAQVAAANDNLARSYRAANDNAQAASQSFVDVGAEVVKTAGHLKFLAAAAYAMSPAFRAMVNPAVVAGLTAMGPAAVAAGGAIVSAMTPALAFMSRIAVPILAVVAAWTLLNQIVDRGSSLLEKYGNAQRDLVAGVDEALAKATRFQDANLSADQVQRASELGARLNEAYRILGDFSRTQLDLTNVALKLQAVWVGIVEVIAAAVAQLNSFLSRIPSIPGWFDTILKVISNIPVIGLPAAGLRAVAPTPTSPVDMEAARAAGYERLKGAMGSESNLAVRFSAFKDVPKEADKATQAVEEVVKAFDQYDFAVQRVRDQIAELELQSQWYGKNSEEVLKLKTAHYLLREAKRAGRDETPELLGQIDAEATRYAKVSTELQKVIEKRRLLDSLGQAGASFLTSLAEGLSKAGKFSDALRGSLKGLGSDLTSIGSQNLAKGLSGIFKGQGLTGFDPVSLGIGAVGMGISALLGRQEEKKRQNEAMWQANIDAANEANRQILEAQQKLAEEQTRLAEETARRIEAAAQRVRSFEDIIFAATNDNSTLEGKLVALQREQDQALIDERKAGGEAEFILLASYEAKRYALLKEANDNIIEEERRSAEERLQATETAARQITDYLLNLRRGSDSPLSASGRLTQSQNAYNATLSLAQGGNLDALGRITQDAEALRTAAQAFFGSGSGYQSIFNQIQQQLTALPAVQSSTDPVVQALNAIAARQEAVYFDATAEGAATAANYASKQVSLQEQMVDALNRMSSLQAEAASASKKAADDAAADASKKAADDAAALESQRAANRARYNKDIENYDWALKYDTKNVYGYLTRGDPRNRQDQYQPMRFGGIVGMFANGGMVGNGIWDQDSVLARYAGGGNIALAGGEFVMPAPQTRAYLPQLEAMRSGGGANDNGAVVAELRALRRENAMQLASVEKRLARVEAVTASGFDRQTTAIKDSDKRERANGAARKRGAAA